MAVAAITILPGYVPVYCSICFYDCHLRNPFADQTQIYYGAWPYTDRLTRAEATAQIEDSWQNRLTRARCGIAEAQYHLAVMYKAGTAPAKEDPVAAYQWISLAARAGYRHAQNMKPIYAKTLTREEIAEAELLIANWKPRCQ